jgi:hypothetical protein
MKIILALFVLFFTSGSFAGQAYDRLLDKYTKEATSVEKNKVIAHYLFRGIGPAYKFDMDLYGKALEESGISDRSIFAEALGTDIALRLLSQLSTEERAWNLQVIAFLRAAKLQGHGYLQTDIFLDLILRRLRERSKSLDKPILGVEVIGDLESLGLGMSKVNSASYSFYELIRNLCLSTPNGPPTAYLSYPFLIIEGRNVKLESPVVPPPPEELFDFMKKLPVMPKE